MAAAELFNESPNPFAGDISKNLESSEHLLSTKLQIIKEDNKRLEAAIKKKIRENEEKKDRTASNYVNKKQEEKNKSSFSLQAVSKLLHLEPAQWADPNILKEKLVELDSMIKGLKDEIKERFVWKESHDMLVKATLQKEALCETFLAMNKTLKSHVKRLKVAIEAAEISAYHEYTHAKRDTRALAKIVNMVIKNFDAELNADELMDYDHEPDHKTLVHTNKSFHSIEQGNDIMNYEREENNVDKQMQQDPSSIDSSLQTKLERISRPKSFDVKTSFVDDDPLKEQEAEMTMDYVEYFSRLFSARKFNEAAFHAIYSPKGILRTPQTMKYFKDIDNVLKKKNSDHKPHLLHYCMLLMSTIDLVGKQPTSWEVIESFKCAISEDRIDLVEFWIAKDHVMLSEPIGNMLMRSCHCIKGSCVCKNSMLAEIVFKKLKAHHQTINVMVHQGRYASVISYARNEARFNFVDYARLLEEDASFDALSKLMIQQHSKLPIEKIIIELVLSTHVGKAISLIKECGKERREINFCYTHFNGCEMNECSIVEFSRECLVNNFEQLSYDFVSCYLVFVSLKFGKEITKVLS